MESPDGGSVSSNAIIRKNAHTHLKMQSIQQIFSSQE